MKPYRRSSALLLLVLSLCSFAPSVSASELSAPVQRLYMIEFSTGPAWLPEKPFKDQPMASEHSLNLRRLREKGELVLGARHGSTGMILLRAISEAAARSEIEKDPTITKGVFIYSIEEFKPFYGGCVELPPPSK